MARQTGDVLFVGSQQGGNGYLTAEGKAYFRLKPGPSRRSWKRNGAFARSRAAAADPIAIGFGVAAAEAGALWRLIPGRMRLLAGEWGYQEMVRAFVAGANGAGNGRLGGFALNLDRVPVDSGIGLELPGVGGGIQGRKRRVVHDFARMQGAWPKAVQVCGLVDGLRPLFGGESGNHHPMAIAYAST